MNRAQQSVGDLVLVHHMFGDFIGARCCKRGVLHPHVVLQRVFWDGQRMSKGRAHNIKYVLQ